MINPIASLSPLDGRYAQSVEALRPIFSEYGLMKARVKVELNWLKALAAEPKIVEVPPFSAGTLAEIDTVIENFSLEDAAAVKVIEATTNHDVKAIEYWLKKTFCRSARSRRCRRVHPLRLHQRRHQQPVPRFNAARSA